MDESANVPNILQAIKNKDDTTIEHLKLLIPDIEDVLARKRILTKDGRKVLSNYFFIPEQYFCNTKEEGLPKEYDYSVNIPCSIAAMMETHYGKKIIYNRLLALKHQAANIEKKSEAIQKDIYKTKEIADTYLNQKEKASETMRHFSKNRRINHDPAPQK